MASASWVAESDTIVETDMGQTSGHTTVTDNGHGSEAPMALPQASPTWLLIVFSAATLPTALSVVMLGPLLVALAHEFQTSVAVAGQLAAATAEALRLAHANVLAIAADDAAKQKSDALLSDGERAIGIGDRALMGKVTAELGALKQELEHEYTLTIVSRVGEPSGVWRRPPGNDDARNHYLIVEAITPDEAVMVGNDYFNDVEPAKWLGIRTIWIERDDPYAPGALPVQDPWAADARISSLAEVPATLARLELLPHANGVAKPPRRKTSALKPRA